MSEDEAPALAGTGCEVVAYEGFTIGPARPLAAPRAALASLGLRGRVGVEDGALAVPGVKAVHADAHALRLLRAVKDDDEIERIRAAIAHLRRRARRRRARRCAAASASSRRGARCRPRWRWRPASASRCCATSSTGERTGEVGGPPGTRVVRDGDLAIVDLVPRLAGYWGDSCATIAIGDVPAEVRSAHARCRDALERGLAALAPGLRRRRSRRARPRGPRLPAPHRPRRRRLGARGAAHRARRRDGARARHDRRARARHLPGPVGHARRARSRWSPRPAARSSASTTSRSDASRRGRGCGAGSRRRPRAAAASGMLGCDVGRRSGVPRGRRGFCHRRLRGHERAPRPPGRDDAQLVHVGLARAAARARLARARLAHAREGDREQALRRQHPAPPAAGRRARLRQARRRLPARARDCRTASATSRCATRSRCCAAR